MAFGIYSFYRLLQPRFRSQRRKWFLEFLERSAARTILDIGGNVYDWQEIPAHLKITVLNVGASDVRPSSPEQISFVVGDGRRLPFADQSLTSFTRIA